MSGTLYICGTPIGNLEDISLRALRTLKEADAIAAEDTRHSLKLLNHFEISTPMISYHEHNKKDGGRRVLELLRRGKSVALVSDAGMPGISDPGQELIQSCHAEGIPVTVVPGPTAAASALVMSGIDCGRFTFEGFLPADKKERAARIGSLIDDERTAIFYEAPHHLTKTLQDLHRHLGDRQIALVREITKKYEQVQRGPISFFLELLETAPPKGEYVIVLSGADPAALQKELQAAWTELSPAEHMQMYTAQGMDKKSAMKAVAKDRGVSKSEIYKLLLSDG